MSVRSALLFARTVRHLRPVQVYGRALRALRRTQPDLSPAPPLRTSFASLEAPARRDPVLLGPERLTLVGEEGAIAARTDWTDTKKSALWLYHLHYFDDLRSEGVEGRLEWNRRLVERWVDENPPCQGVGWDPYPTSLRIVNWVAWERRAGQPLTESSRASLAVQARHLAANLEHHLLGNHLLANAKALVFAGAHFDGDEARRWLGRGIALLRRELAEQVLDDGGHFERSPMYHALVLEDVLDLIALCRAVPEVLGSFEADWRSLAQRMLTWLRVMTHPDGEIALFNDAAIGQAPAPAALEEYARRLGCGYDARSGNGTAWLRDSGYVRLERDGLVAICDVGEIGPSYLPGHAHADTLSFEASLHGRRLIVDSGTSHYAPGAERLRQRSTSAHNTVEIDGASSSEIWSSFRVARRARVRDVAVEERGNELCVRAAHDGYRRLAGRNTHVREWRLGETQLLVADRVEGPFERATARLHFHPDWRPTRRSDREIEITAADGQRVCASSECAALDLEPTTWHPRFGASVPSDVLRMELAPGASTRTALTLSW